MSSLADGIKGWAAKKAAEAAADRERKKWTAPEQGPTAREVEATKRLKAMLEYAPLEDAPVLHLKSNLENVTEIRFVPDTVGGRGDAGIAVDIHYRKHVGDTDINYTSGRVYRDGSVHMDVKSDMGHDRDAIVEEIANLMEQAGYARTISIDMEIFGDRGRGEGGDGEFRVDSTSTATDAAIDPTRLEFLSRQEGVLFIGQTRSGANRNKFDGYRIGVFAGEAEPDANPRAFAVLEHPVTENAAYLFWLDGELPFTAEEIASRLAERKQLSLDEIRTIVEQQLVPMADTLRSKKSLRDDEEHYITRIMHTGDNWTVRLQEEINEHRGVTPAKAA